MEKVVRTFNSHSEAEKAEREYYRSLTPEERLNILLELVEQGNRDAPKGFERVYRIVDLKDQ